MPDFSRYIIISAVFAAAFLCAGAGEPPPPETIAAVQQTDSEDDDEWKPKSYYVPVPFYKPETGWGGSFTAAFLYKSGKSRNTPPSMMNYYMNYTQNHQNMLSFEMNHYFKNYEHYIKARIEYIKFPDKFYGVGNRTKLLDEEDFTPQTTGVWVEYYKRISGKIFAGARARTEHTVILSAQAGGLLDTLDIPGSAGGLVSGVELLFQMDERDNVYFARDGGYYRLSAGIFNRVFGSDFDFSRYEADIRRYVPLNKNCSLSLQGLFVFNAGNAPLNFMGLMGGDTQMRGYYKGRFRDKNMSVFQAEYKWILHERICAVFFAGYGGVFERVDSFSTQEFKISAGGGLRFFIDPKDRLTVRLDAGVGSDGPGIYIIAGEAF
ncbi:MAG: BamA/TamA family outer membrane protein [Candidatus Goldiibacteriota bacterium]